MIMPTLNAVFIGAFLSGAFLQQVICGKCPQLITEFSQDTCTARSAKSENDTFYFDLEANSCVPKCNSYKENVLKNCSLDQKCMPGYICDKRCKSSPSDDCEDDDDCNGDKGDCGFYCVADNEESCMAYHINLDDYKETYWSALRFKPACNNDGTWKAKQCKGGVDGRCMCYDKKGTRIFGEAPFQNAENMTCACSKRKAELDAVRTTSFHCDSMGNYEPLQCDIVSGQCWCVEPTNGTLLSTVVPQKAIYLLPCFSMQKYGTQYLRKCESKLFAQLLIKKKLEYHGVKQVSQDFLLCDADGSYGAFTIENDNAYCTWRNNSKIGSWQTNIQSGFSDLDCNCARDFYKYQHSQTCLSTGNYKPLQIGMDQFYCVDKDGFLKSQIYTKLNVTEDSFCSKFY